MKTIEIPGRVPGEEWEALKKRLDSGEGVETRPSGVLARHGSVGLLFPMTQASWGIVSHLELPLQLQAESTEGEPVAFRTVTGEFPVTDRLSSVCALEETVVASGRVLRGSSYYVGVGADVCPYCGFDNGEPDSSARMGWDCGNCGGN